MTLETARGVSTGTSTETSETGTRPNQAAGVAIMSAGAISAQTGAAVAAHAFPAIGPLGVVVVRQLVAAAVLVPLSRPSLRRLTWRQFWPCLVLGVVFAVMSLALYTSIDRIGLGLAVTLEFLGPLSVALLGSRTRADLVLAIFTALGVYVLVLPGPSSDLLGIGLGLAAAACWALYIVTNRVAGQRLPGLQATAVATIVSATLSLPVVIVLVVSGRLSGTPLLLAVVAGILSSAIPYATDLTALRRVSPAFFGVFMSVHPVLAALAGLILLGQVLAPHEWWGIAIIVMANALATALAHRGEPGYRGGRRHARPERVRVARQR